MTADPKRKVQLKMNIAGSFLVLLAATALSGCESAPVKEIKGIFQRATDGPTVTETERPGESKAETKVQAATESTAASRVDAEKAPPAAAPDRGSPELLAGIKAYEDGKYREAAKTLLSALPRLSKADQVRAHKYLAFIDCTSGRKIQCRNEFVKALKIDPAFELEPSEAGHPVWGPVFRSVKQKRAR